MFNKVELSALRLGARMVQGWADPELAKSAAAALAKIECALPEQDSGDDSSQVPMIVPDFFIPVAPKQHLRLAREAIESRRKLRLQYTDVRGESSQRTVRPLGLAYWGRTWTLAAWCELREDYRDFRVDRITAVTLIEDRIPEDPEVSLANYLRTREPQD
jgi:predicted DNA-binding transcriptional regulator YafY